MKIEILPRTVDGIMAHCDKTGMTHSATYSRLIQWLVNQDERTQAAILGLLDESASIELPEAILKKIIRDLKLPGSRPL